MSSQKPQISKNESLEIKSANKVTDQVVLIGIRGYYLDSLGKRGENDRNVYDDAIIVLSSRRFEAFRANTDPSIYRLGIATMKTGVYRYYKGKHKNRYWALRLVGEQVPVTRDGQDGTKVGIALNIHKGGNRTTGSEGCQTLMPSDWDDFIEIVYDEMAFCNQKTIPYILIDEKDRRRGTFKSPLLAEKEIDNLLIRFDKDEPAAQVGDNIQNPVSNPAPNPAAQSSVSQSPKTSASAALPVPPKLDLPSLGGYITGAQQKAAQAQDAIGSVLGTVDQIKIIKDAIDSRKDGAKSLWATVLQAVYQTAWAVVAFLIGLPVEVWIVVAAIVGIVGLAYLYRQISLGKVRDMARLELLRLAEILK